MKNNDFQEFMKLTNNKVPKDISDKISSQMSAFVSPKSSTVLFKYSIVFILSSMLSLFLCPQKGLGFLKNSYPLFTHFLHSNVILCGLYCGLMFFVITHLSAFLFLNHFERLKVLNDLKVLPHAFFALFFGVFMFFSTDHFNYNLAYNSSWIAIVLLSLFSSRYYYKNKHQILA